MRACGARLLTAHVPEGQRAASSEGEGSSYVCVSAGGNVVSHKVASRLHWERALYGNSSGSTRVPAHVHSSSSYRGGSFHIGIGMLCFERPAAPTAPTKVMAFVAALCRAHQACLHNVPRIHPASHTAVRAARCKCDVARTWPTRAPANHWPKPCGAQGADQSVKLFESLRYFCTESTSIAALFVLYLSPIHKISHPLKVLRAKIGAQCAHAPYA